MQGVYDEIKELGGDVLVVSFASPERVKAFLDESPRPFPVVSDADRAAYRAFGLERTTVGAMLRPGVIARYLGMMFRGWLPSKPGGGDDVLQLGGDFVLDADGKVLFAHSSVEPTDRPKIQELVKVFRR